MNILFYQWNAYNLSDTRWAFEQKGFTVTMLTEPIANPEENTEYVCRLTRRLSAGTYDFVFSLNYFPVLAESCREADIPYVCWNCDGSLLAMYHTSIFYPTNVIFSFDYKNYMEFKTMGVENIYYLPLAVNTHRLERQLSETQYLPDRTVVPDGCSIYPVSFVGNLYENNTYRKIAGRLPDYLAGYLRGAINAQKLVSGGNILEVLLTDDIVEQLEALSTYHRSEQSFASVKQLFATTVLGFQTASEERAENLAALSARHEVHLFTESTSDGLELVKCHPPVSYDREMPQVFRHSSVNLNMTIPNITTGIPLRVWDVLGSGGFLLSDYQPEFDNYFEPGKHMDTFEDTGELLEKTEFYLQHESCRRKIAFAGQALAAGEHNYITRIEQMLKILRQLSVT